jgi:ferredoxin-nitrate reductase
MRVGRFDKLSVTNHQNMTSTPTEHPSTCCYCGVGCGVVVSKHGDGTLGLRGDESHPSNRGLLCSKGMNLHYTAMDRSDRLLHPTMRLNRSMPMQRVSWDAALDRTAAVFKTFIEKYGPDSVGFYVSGQCLTEEYYVVNKLIKGFIGSNNIDTNSRLCMSSAVVGYKLTLGEDAVPICYDDLDVADCFFVAGSNAAWAHPIIWRRIEANKAKNPGTRIIVVDPRRTQTAAVADLHLQLAPGTDVTLSHAIARVLIENDWIDSEFIENHVDGFTEYRESVFRRTLTEAAAITGVPVSDIQLAARYLHESTGYLSLWTMGLNQSVVGVNKNLALISLHLITGRIGSPGNGPFSLTGQPNAMGGREVGGLANLLPAHRDLANPAHRAEVERFWDAQAPINPKPGLTATELFEALNDGRLKALWIIGTNPLVSMPDVTLVEAAMKKARFVVVQDVSNRSDTLAYADVVLPAATWLEKEGTMTNSERRITYLPKVLDAPGEALPDVNILLRFAEKMGWHRWFDYPDNAAIYAEHAALTAGTNCDVSGVTYDVLKEKRSVQWPYPGQEEKAKREKGKENTEAETTPLLFLGGVPEGRGGPAERGARPSHFGTPRLFTDHQFFTENKKAQLHPVPDENASEPTDERYPLILITGRIRDQWHTMTRSGKVAKLRQHLSEPFLEIHPDDAAERGIAEAQLVEIESRRGTARVKAQLTTDVKRGVCFLPMHFGRVGSDTNGRANNLTNSLVDPRSKEPDFKFSAVQVRVYEKPVEKIIIVGAGSGGLGFVQSYRQLNRRDEIHVFSKEIYPFYNRVLLPDYLSGAQGWDQLVKLREDQFADLDIRVHTGVGIEHIDRQNQVVTDSNGQEHAYDRLILATGSRAFLPPNFPKLPGVLNMRSRLDADALLPFLTPAVVEPRRGTDAGGSATHSTTSRAFSHSKGFAPAAVIVGGGLLGIELAGSLRQMGVRVTIVQKISRFMDRQLDPLGSELLRQELVDRGCELFFNDEVAHFYGTERLEGVRLLSGRKIACDVLVAAIGTVPNTELARAAGLDCGRGVVVNDSMQTSDERIFALGEIAQWRNQLWGITAAAEQQAEVAARYLAGDGAKPYRGSLSMNILKMEGLNLVSLGLPEAPPDDPSYEEIVFIDKAKRYYKKCLVHRDRLVGAILIGDKSEFQEFRDLIANGLELSDKRLELLRSGKRADPVQGKLVCSCHTIGQGNLEAAIASGCTDFAKLCQTTGAGTGCGSCRPEVRGILERATRKEKVTLSV